MTGYTARKQYGIADIVSMFTKILSPIIHAVTEELTVAHAPKRKVTPATLPTPEPVAETPVAAIPVPETTTIQAPFGWLVAETSVDVDTTPTQTVIKGNNVRANLTPRKPTVTKKTPKTPKATIKAKPQVMASAARVTKKPTVAKKKAKVTK